jgi:methionine-rich copper-binding protein CopC
VRVNPLHALSIDTWVGRRRWMRFALPAGLIIALLLAMPLPANLLRTADAAGPCDPPITNPITCENTKTGNPSTEWDISGAGSTTIQGFATDISVNKGQTVQFKVKTPATAYRFDIYRMGYYGGNGARKITTVNPSASLPQSQPNCLTQASTGLVDCGNWAVSGSWAVPPDAVSGIYFAKLVRTDGTSGSSHIYFIVRDDTGNSPILFQTSDTTWQAYNDYGGNSLYTGSPAGRAYKVSYNRPFVDREGAEAQDFVFNSEYPMVRFLERNGYNVSYTTGVDSDRRGNLIQNHNVFLSVGHDEYWSGQQRANVEAARDAGVDLAFFSGNESFWKTRWESSIDSSGTAHRTLVCYKETHANDTIDPQDPPTWTGTWRDPRFSPPADGGRPENTMTGTIFKVNDGTSDIRANFAEKDLRFWRNTRVANLTSGQSTAIGADTLGYEWDEDADNGARPAGLIDMSRAAVSGVQVLQDYGSSYGQGDATHSLTLYKHPASGALVFGAGSIQWAWALDDEHDRAPAGGGTSDAAGQQATVNLLADMGVQPGTLMSGLVAATQTTDTAKPTSTITSPANGGTVGTNQNVTITGTAADTGGTGGVVGGVEVSTDNGATWHPATGRANWTYSWQTPGAGGTATIRTRATDDSGNTETPSAGVTVTVGSGPPPPPGDCPCTIWPSSATPATAADSDGDAVEVGVKFRANQNGQITGIRFYKGSTNTGTHLGRLWSATGTQLATATFSGETATGWQQVNFATPVSITAGTTYVASYYAPAGHYAVNENYFATATVNGPLTALANGTDGGNGVYRYGTGGGFPTLSYNASNYWVDVVFDTGADTTPPTVTARTPASGATGVPVGTTVTATFSEAIQTGTAVVTLTGPSGTVAGSTTYDAATRTVTFTPTAAMAATTSYTASVSGAKDSAGNTMTAVSWSFTTGAVDTTPPAVTARTPAAGATGVPVTTTVTATFSEDIQPGTAAVTLTGPSGAVTGTTTYDAPTRTVTFTPGASLASSASYTAAVSGARDVSGNVMTAVNWTFTTAAPTQSGCPCTIWPSTATPATANEDDSSAVEVGVKFRASQAGQVTGVRFYKGSQNTGTHVGKLWSSTGTLLASATFTSETASGWQQVNFSAPVTVTAGTTYVASYYAPVGRYSVTSNGLAAAVVRGPLTALANGADGGNGVYRYGTGGGFPTSTWEASNYWVDVVFVDSGGAPDTTPPTVTARSPVAGATGVALTAAVTATFSEPIQAGTATVTLTGPGSTNVPGTTTYDGATQTVTFTPTASLAASTSYTANMSGAKDLAGNTMTAVTWSFTTGAAPPPSSCPCTIWPSTATPATPAAPDDSAAELGVKFRTSEAGYITGVRFYKGAGNTGTHVGNLWSANGTNLASATFTGETASGWQQVDFGAPVPVSANTTYIASYHAPNGNYALNDAYFASGPTTNGPLTALQDGTDGGNGVYSYGGSGFPTSTFGASNYWVDVVFNTTATDTTLPTVTDRAPAPGASGVPADVVPTATFSEPVQQPTITMELRKPDNSLVTAALTYDSSTRTARLTPQSPLAYSTSYTVNLSGAKDLAGNTMAPLTWSFTTGAQPPPGPDQGPGGPIAVLTSNGDKLTKYTAEILRAEGLNEFATVDMGSATATTLAAYDTAILGAMTLTSAQVTMLTDWVNAGGNLIAYKPDPQLASLLGLTSAGTTLSEGYLLVNTAQAPGAGITNQTIQFHGTADRYTLNGATSVATLYSNATTATPNPAVTLRSVGANGGQAAAFTYDLAKSIVQTRQGNPAWAGQERDGGLNDGVIRSDDMFYPNWVNLNKVAIPQADEQQRLLANLIEDMNRDRKPLPRFWYFPNGHKAVVVATGDDHGNNGTAGRFDQYAANSAAGCSVANWQCLRFSSYIYASTPLSNSQALSYHNSGFEVASHPNNGCSNYSSQAALATTYTNDLSDWASKYTSLPAPVSNRFHCLVWSDWASQPKVELSNGIRLDANYYYWPGAWIQDRPGFMTGSGMPMRFADTDGGMIDVYQAATQMTDESGQSYPLTSDTLLENALGSLGYYGAFTANMHTDSETTLDSDQMLASATAHGVPMITARQLLTWLDGRNASSFKNIGWSSNTLSFTVEAGAGASGLQAMVPTAGPGGTTLSGITRSGSSVSYTLQSIKGMQYAVFSASAGTYSAAYSGAGALVAPLVASAEVASTTDATATLQWQTSEAATTEVVYGATPESLGNTSVDGAATSDHEATLEGLRPGATYYYRLRSTDVTGQRTTWPPTSQEPLAFTTDRKDSVAPRITAVKALPLPDGTATVTWTTNEPADSAVAFGASPGQLAGKRVDDGQVRSHQVVLTGLAPGKTYWYQVTSRDADGNGAASPEIGRVPRRFVSSAPGVADHSQAKFTVGKGTGVVVQRANASSTGQLALGAGRRSGKYVSRVMDSGAMVTWDRAMWRAVVPAGASVRVYVRTGSTSEPDSSWTSWQRQRLGDVIGADGRYIQYRVELAGKGAKLVAIGFTHNGDPPLPAREVTE